MIDFKDFTLYIRENSDSAAAVRECLGAELAHTEDGAPLAEGFTLSLSDTANLTFLAVSKRGGKIGVDAELLSRTPPPGFSSVFDWTDLEAYCKASGENLFALAKNPPDLSKIPDIEITRITTHGCAVSVAATWDVASLNRTEVTEV